MSWDSLPEPALAAVLSFIDNNDVLSLSVTSRRLHNVTWSAFTHRSLTLNLKGRNLRSDDSLMRFLSKSARCISAVVIDLLPEYLTWFADITDKFPPLKSMKSISLEDSSDNKKQKDWLYVDNLLSSFKLLDSLSLGRGYTISAAALGVFLKRKCRVRCLEIPLVEFAVTEEIYQLILTHPFIESLKVNVNGRKVLSTWPFVNLKHAHFSRTQCKVEDIVNFIKHNPRLESLEIPRSSIDLALLTRDHFETHLVKEFDLSRCSLLVPHVYVDVGFKKLEQLFPNLTTLRLSHMQSLFQETMLADLACSCTHLKRLYLDGCLQVTDAAVKRISALEEIRYLNLNYCGAVTDASLQFLMKVDTLDEIELNFLDRVDGSFLYSRTETSSRITIRIDYSRSQHFKKNKQRLGDRLQLAQF